ncbi:MAG TPA: response regulator [Chitinophagaceae bacterium]
MMYRICIVEDDEGIQDVLTIILQRSGYDICVFAEGTTVMQPGFHMPDLFLIDKQLPDTDGLDICRFLKTSPLTANIPVVMMSAYPNARQLCQDAGADAFIEKPFQLEHLLSTVKRFTASEAVA